MQDPWNQNISGGVAALLGTNYKQATKQFRAALRRAESQGDHERIHESLVYLAEVHIRKDDFSEETEGLFRRALSSLEQLPDADELRLGYSHLSLAKFYLATSRPELVDAHIEPALRFAESAPGGPKKVDLLQGLVWAYALLKNHEKVTQVWQLAQTATVHNFGPSSEEALMSLEMYVKLLENLGRTDSEEAAKARIELAQLGVASRSSSHQSPEESSPSSPMD